MTGEATAAMEMLGGAAYSPDFMSHLNWGNLWPGCVVPFQLRQNLGGRYSLCMGDLLMDLVFRVVGNWGNQMRFKLGILVFILVAMAISPCLAQEDVCLNDLMVRFLELNNDLNLISQKPKSCEMFARSQRLVKDNILAYHILGSISEQLGLLSKRPLSVVGQKLRPGLGRGNLGGERVDA